MELAVGELRRVNLLESLIGLSSRRLTLKDAWIETLPVMKDFSRVSDPSQYRSLPDNWHIGISDVVNSTKAIELGNYKAVNLAGAGTISALANEIGDELRLFLFGGDGARFAVPAAQARRAAKALSRVAMWVKRDLDLELRVGMVSVAEIRAAGLDVRSAFWQASDHVRYAMFMGGGLEWAEAQIKAGSFCLQPADPGDEPNLAGLSCQWGPIRARNGKIVSLIVRPVEGISAARFSDIVSKVVELLRETTDPNPVPPDGPDVRWPARAIGLQSRIANMGKTVWLRRLHVLCATAFAWLIFKLGIRIAKFDPSQYRREIAVNTDFRKFDDALMMTVDCATDVIAALRELLDKAVEDGTVHYGLYTQNEALLTCVVPSVRNSDHMHFVDGGDGGYTAAARQLHQQRETIQS